MIKRRPPPFCIWERWATSTRPPAGLSPPPKWTRSWRRCMAAERPGPTLAIGSLLRQIKWTFNDHLPVRSFSLDFRQLQKHFIERVEAASGKPVILQSDPKFAGHATIKIATKDQPAHLLLYKPEQESVLPYLVAYECEFALRTIQADPSTQFNLASKPSMQREVLELMQRHHKGRDDIPSHAVPQLAQRFGDGLGLQLRSMPITMRIDKLLHDAHPELTELQHESIDRSCLFSHARRVSVVMFGQGGLAGRWVGEVRRVPVGRWNGRFPTSGSLRTGDCPV